MRHRALSRIAAIAIAAAVASPALAHGHGQPMPSGNWHGHGWIGGGWFGGWQGGWQDGWQVTVQQDNGAEWNRRYDEWNRQRDAWLTECRHRLSDNGVAGAAIGGVVGAVAGNALAGHDDKALGTVAGAAAGAIAGAAIDKAQDHGRTYDQCEAILQGYGANGYPGYGYAYAAPVVWVPVMVKPADKPKCTETVTTEYITTYEPVRHRTIPPRPHYKRVRAAPDKRVRGS